MTNSRAPHCIATEPCRAAGLLALAVLLVGASSPALAQNLDRIRESGTLVIGYGPDAHPFSYREANGEPAGYAVTLCQHVAEGVKLELGMAEIAVELVPIASAEDLESPGASRPDLFCGVVASLERRERFDFSIPIFPSGIGAVLRADASERLKAVLEGREVPYRPNWRASLGAVFERRVLSAPGNTVVEQWLREKKTEFQLDSEIAPVTDYAEGVRRVIEGESAVFFGDRALLLDAAARSGEANELAVLNRIFTYQPVAILLPRGDSDLRLAVDRVLSALYRTEKIEDIYTQFFGPPTLDVSTFFRLMALPE